MPACWAGEAQPGQASSYSSANGGVEPQGAPARLTCVPDGDDLLRVGDLALGLTTLRFGRDTCGVAFAFLRSAVRAEGLLEKFGDK